jgi:hypothetical protein
MAGRNRIRPPAEVRCRLTCLHDRALPTVVGQKLLGVANSEGPWTPQCFEIVNKGCRPRRTVGSKRIRPSPSPPSTGRQGIRTDDAPVARGFRAQSTENGFLVLGHFVAIDFEENQSVRPIESQAACIHSSRQNHHLLDRRFPHNPEYRIVEEPRANRQVRVRASGIDRVRRCSRGRHHLKSRLSRQLPRDWIGIEGVGAFRLQRSIRCYPARRQTDRCHRHVLL